MNATTRSDPTRGARLLAAGGLAYLGWRFLQELREASLAGEVVMITGGSRGLGLLLAQEFAQEGCKIAICARDPAELDAASGHLRAAGAELLALACDVADRAQVKEMLARVTQHFGRIDVLVNNASIIQVGPLGAMKYEDFEHAMAVNFWGSINTIMEVLPQMRGRRSGRIVNITSIGGKVAIPHLLPYDCAKFATVALSEGLRTELAKDNIAVTTIVPGLMRTGSPVNAFFKGDPSKEFTWFSIGDATPLTAMSARRAARRIVEATKRGEAEVTLTWQAKLLRSAHGLFPGIVTDLLGVVNRTLPGSEEVKENVRGMDLATPASPSALTGLMNRAARENNEYAGHPEPSPQHAQQAGLREKDDTA